MNEHIVASSSASVPTITGDPAADEKKKTDNPVLKVRTRKKSDGISKDDSAADSVGVSKPKTRDNSADKAVNVQRSSVQLPDSGEDPEDPVYHDSIPEGYVPSADDNLLFSSETQSLSTLEPPQDAGPGTSTSASPVDGNTGPLEENGRQELVDLQKKIKMMEIEQVDSQKKIEMMEIERVDSQKKIEMMEIERVDSQKKIEMMEIERVDSQKKIEMMEIKLTDLIQQLKETGHNSRTTSLALIASGGRGERVMRVDMSLRITHDILHKVLKRYDEQLSRLYKAFSLALIASGGRGERVMRVDMSLRITHDILHKVLKSSAFIATGSRGERGTRGYLDMSSVIGTSEGPVYSIFYLGRRGERGTGGCLDKHSFQLASLQGAGTSTSATHDGATTATVDERTIIQSQSSAQTLSSKNRPKANNENASSVMPLTEDPAYLAPIAPGRRGERGNGGCLAKADDKPSFQLSLPSCQKAEAGTSITSATYDGTSTATVDKRTSIQSQAGSSKSRPMANDKNASVEELKGPGDAGHVSGASGAAKVFKWMFLTWTFYLRLSMKCKKLFTRIKVYKVMSLVSDVIFYLCSWTHFHISKGVASLVPLCFFLFFLYVLPNSVENDYFQVFIKEFTNIGHVIFLFKRFLDTIAYIKDQEYVADATANPLLYSVLVFLPCLFILLNILKKK